MDIVVIERGPATNESPTETYDHRVYALSPASLALLKKIGVELPRARMAPVRAMQVFGDDNNSKVDFVGGEPLATIVEHAALMQALHAGLVREERAQTRYGVSPVEMRRCGGNRHELVLSDGSTLVADLLVAADGSRSQIRQWANISAQSRDYESDGVVANFRTEFAHGDVARQWFTREAVLAYLPLPGNQVSIVWSVGKIASAGLSTGDSQAFCAAVAEAGHRALGDLALVSPIARFPLVRIMADNWVQPGLALIGDAAHAVHPLAGQGVNLGFRDVCNMIAVLQERSKFSAMGDLAVLRRYERAGQEAAWAVGEMTDRLRTLYQHDAAAMRWVRNDGLAMLNRMPAAKSRLIDYVST
jgi:ubiquinone biosynthesis UbiH/UbiF/VisC/COQ6 family hydroxylase